VNEDKTRVYLERSKSLPLDLSLRPYNHQNSHHPFFKIVPQAIGRLRSLSINIKGPLDALEEVSTRLSRPAPLLEKLSICAHNHVEPHLHPVLTPALFNGDLSSLRSLRLQAIRTKLPWRNMVNLTSLDMYDTSQDGVSIRELLDFFESAPRLRKVNLRKVSLRSAMPTSGAQNGRLVSLPCLERMVIAGCGPATLLLDHLLIPVGVYLVVEVDLPIKNHPPGFSITSGTSPTSLISTYVRTGIIHTCNSVDRTGKSG
jgi:hypothetical protein